MITWEPRWYEAIARVVYDYAEISLIIVILSIIWGIGRIR